MTTSKKKRSTRVSDFVIIAVIILSVGLIAFELITNVSTALESEEPRITQVEEAAPTAVPTLTKEERQELLSQPVSEGD